MVGLRPSFGREASNVPACDPLDPPLCPDALMRAVALPDVQSGSGNGVRGQGQPLGRTLDLAIKVRVLVPEHFRNSVNYGEGGGGRGSAPPRQPSDPPSPLPCASSALTVALSLESTIAATRTPNGDPTGAPCSAHFLGATPPIRDYWSMWAAQVFFWRRRARWLGPGRRSWRSPRCCSNPGASPAARQTASCADAGFAAVLVVVCLARIAIGIRHVSRRVRQGDALGWIA
jgi:hypothetical protein